MAKKWYYVTVRKTLVWNEGVEAYSPEAAKAEANKRINEAGIDPDFVDWDYESQEVKRYVRE